MAGKKFVELHESYMRRYERGGFLVGDVFKFNDNFKSSDGYKALGSNTQELLDQMIDSGLHIRIVGIKDTSPSRYPANPDTSSLNVVLDLALDTGGGRYSHYCSVPGELGGAVEYYPNLLPIPDAMKRPDNVNIKPKEFVEDEELPANRSDRGGTEPHDLTPTERTLPKKNTEIPCDPATPSQAVTSYTNQYLSDLKPASYTGVAKNLQHK
tara:strand:+ start:15615 stop:16247 length:633 start_codon:yes stop_codon:yes gene_type:complete